MSLKLLIVDDSKLARMAVGRTLNNIRPDWERVEAANADEALALIIQGGFKIVLMDFNMPGRDGLALASELRELDPDMPLALISANLQTEIVDRASAIGAHFLPKPLTQEAMNAFVATAEQKLGMA
ncbi:MAG TPA: response regulator [Caulobacteraceae bacterium]|jgi:DNA-binding NarL/FixJ family response regulator|nr:response regulator [Caulobacteraceae bacterium]